MRIEVAAIPGGYIAYLVENRKCWEAGASVPEAVGRFIEQHQEIFGIEVEVLTIEEQDERRDTV